MSDTVLIKTRGAKAPFRVSRAVAEILAAEPGRLDPPIGGTVYGVVLNVRDQVALYAEAMGKAPYQAPPKAPVIYIKTPNTYAPHGTAVPFPAGEAALEVKATLAVVFACGIGRATEAQAMAAVLGYTLALDVCIPHQSLYRPAIRQRCRDGFLPIGPWIAGPDRLDPDATEITLSVNGVERTRFSTADLMRPVSRLIAEIADFSTFQAGDVLLVGLPAEGALVGIGDTVSAEAQGLGRLDCGMAAETFSGAMA